MPAPSPPTGTITFLFNDIEGSTRLWEQDARDMQVALARHDEILRGVIEINESYTASRVGDPVEVARNLDALCF